MIHVMKSFLKLLHLTMLASLNVIMQNPTQQSTKTLTKVRRKSFYTNVFAILLSSLLMAICSCIKTTCTTQMEKREVWVYPSNGFIIPRKWAPKLISLIWCLTLKLSFPNVRRSRTCIFDCWSNFLGAKWKLHATLFTSKEHIATFPIFLFYKKPSILHYHVVHKALTQSKISYPQLAKNYKHITSMMISFSFRIDTNPTNKVTYKMMIVK